MGTWAAGPFGNDTAADFCGTLDDAADGDRVRLVRDTLARAVGTTGYLDADVAQEAVAAAALVAAQCPDGEPSDPHYAPEKPLPDLTGLRELAAQALDRVLCEPSELMELWSESDGGRWQADVKRLRNTLLPRTAGGR